MRVIATNIGKPYTFVWKGKEEQTGIFKSPIAEAINLQNTAVEKDTIVDHRHHGGIYKACYLFSSDHYPYWRNKYPSLMWDWGMFGENITVEGLKEDELFVGAVYKLGTALVQITLPREPCYKLGIRFNDQDIIPAFIAHGHPGTYVRILEMGKVQTGDSFELYKKATNSLSITDLFKLIYAKSKDPQLLSRALAQTALPDKTLKKLSRF